jgi:hypothetical protein
LQTSQASVIFTRFSFLATVTLLWISDLGL